jgi:hypothetical protein
MGAAVATAGPVATGDAVIIDAADDADRIIEEAAPYRVQAILTTHNFGPFEHDLMEDMFDTLRS